MDNVIKECFLENRWEWNDYVGGIPELPVEYKKVIEIESLWNFLCDVKDCVSPSEQAWFLTYKDLEVDKLYPYSMFRDISIESADDDKRLIGEIKEFWRSHIPFLFSVKTGYAYFAICLNSEDFGKVVCGFEPEFEEINCFCDNFSGFMEILMLHISKKSVNNTLYAMI
jgi:hypothetical protein